MIVNFYTGLKLSDLDTRREDALVNLRKVDILLDFMFGLGISSCNVDGDEYSDFVDRVIYRYYWSSGACEKENDGQR